MGHTFIEWMLTCLSWLVVKGSLVLPLCLSLAGLLSEILLTHSRERSPWTMPPAFLGQLTFSPVPTPDQNPSDAASSVDGGGEQWPLCTFLLT